MLDSLKHRGPDGVGVKFSQDEFVALGHARLSIIDLSDTGRQPMTNEDGSLWLTFNGEIYNYPDLRKELLQKGHRFKSVSDSETILHAYEEWGTDCVKRFRGIFAFGIYNTGDKSFFLARDHVGVKPLYYFSDDSTFIFASQPSAILASRDVEPVLNESSLSLYLAFGNVPGAYSIYRDIRKLLPGHYMLYTQGQVTIRSFWSLKYAPVIHDFREAESALQRKITDSVRVQSISDVPVGSLLSGGIDSTIITTVLAHEKPRLSTFTLGFDDPLSDERPFAKFIADHCLSKHYDQLLSYHEACGLLPEIVQAYDEPFHLNGLFPFYGISKLVRGKGLKVVMGGDGGDELLAGYRWYDALEESTDYHKPGWIGSFKRFIHNWGIFDQNLFKNSFPFYGHLDAGEQRPVLGHRMKHIDLSLIENLLRKHWNDSYPPVLAAQVQDFNCFLPDHCLVKVDRASMACGVEVRVPFLDVDLIDLVFTIDHDIVYRHGERKALLKSSMKDWLPEGMDTNRKKGFSSPLVSWLQSGFAARGRDFLLGGGLCQSGYLDPDALVKAYKTISYDTQLLLISAELWYRCWIENDMGSIINFSNSLRDFAVNVKGTNAIAP